MVINTTSLTPFQLEAFMETIDASFSVSRRTQLFSWLQGGFQALIPHEIMVCGIRMGNSENIQFDHFSSTRYFTNIQLEEATRANHGVISRAMTAWTKTFKPILIADDLIKGDFGQYVVPFQEPEGALQRVELQNIAAYGIADYEGVSTFFSFSRISGELNAEHAYALQLLVPYLHATLSRMMMAGVKPLHKPIASSSVITSREIEILQAVHNGQTNQIIADQFNISPLTVKNHVQSILRKLGVQNRSHAALKALNMGLIKPADATTSNNNFSGHSTKVNEKSGNSAGLHTRASVQGAAKLKALGKLKIKTSTQQF